MKELKDVRQLLAMAGEIGLPKKGYETQRTLAMMHEPSNTAAREMIRSAKDEDLWRWLRIEDFGEDIHKTILERLGRDDVLGMVVYENQMLDSSQLGQQSFVIYGPGCETFKDLDTALWRNKEEKMVQWIYDLPSQRQHAEAYFVKPAKRCGECENCKRIEEAQRVLMPNPPFRHATDFSVQCWNQRLYDYPCQSWSEDDVERDRARLLSVSPAVRPHAHAEAK